MDKLIPLLFERENSEGPKFFWKHIWAKDCDNWVLSSVLEALKRNKDFHIGSEEMRESLFEELLDYGQKAVAYFNLTEEKKFDLEIFLCSLIVCTFNVRYALVKIDDLGNAYIPRRPGPDSIPQKANAGFTIKNKAIYAKAS